MFDVARHRYTLPVGVDAGRRICFVDQGPRDAPVVLMLHGNPTWSFLWRKVIAQLPRVRCIAPDLLGLGQSDRLPTLADHSIDRHADAIAELVRALDLPRFVLVGQDWGGPIAAAIGARMPEKIAGLVLGNTSLTVPKNPRGTAFHRFARLPIVSDIAFRGLGVPQIALWIAQGDRRSISGKVARAYRWPLRHFSDRIAPLALARMVPDSPDHPSMPALREGHAWARSFQGPVALVWGCKDPVLARALPRHRELFPGAPVTTTDAGHFLQEEVPDALAAAIEDVLARAQVDAARTPRA
jgi:pimeloyl-ACP methyl ester carboxylesterase